MVWTILLSFGPSIGDIGLDIKQGHQYIQGDIYTKTVTNPNDSSIENYNCTLLDVTLPVYEG